MSTEVRLISSMALNSGACAACTQPIRSGSNIYVGEEGNGYLLHSRCLLSKLSMFNPVPEDLEGDLSVAQEQLGAKITHVNQQPVESEIVRRGDGLCKAGTPQEVKRLLESGPVLEAHFQEAFYHAVLEGNLPLVKAFLQGSTTINAMTEKVLYSYLYTAASKGKEIKKDSQEREQSKEFALNDARLSPSYVNSHPDQFLAIIQTLLKDRKITPEERGELVIAAVIHGHNEIAKEFLNEEISVAKRGMALCIAAEKINSSMVEELLKTNDELFSRHLNYAYTIAKKNGDLESIDFIQTKLNPATPADLAQLEANRLSLFASSRMDEGAQSLDSLLSKIQTYPEWNGIALSLAASKEASLPNIAKLLEKGVSKQKRGEALCILLKEGLGNQERVALFLQKPIRHQDRIQAIQIASEQKQWGIVQQLLQGQREIPQEFRDELFIQCGPQALQSDNADAKGAARALIANGRISDEAKKKVLAKYTILADVFFDELKGDLPKIEHPDAVLAHQPLAFDDEVVLALASRSSSSSSSSSMSSSSTVSGLGNHRQGNNGSNQLPSSSSTRLSKFASSQVFTTHQSSSTSTTKSRQQERRTIDVTTTGFEPVDSKVSTPRSDSVDEEDDLVETTEGKGNIFSFNFSVSTALRIANIVFPALVLLGTIASVYAYATIGMTNPVTICLIAGTLVLTIACVALYILARYTKPVAQNTKETEQA